MVIIMKLFNIFLLIVFTIFSDILNAQQLNIIDFSPQHNAIIDTSQKSLYIVFNTHIDTNNLKEKLRILGSYTALRNYDYSFSSTDCTLNIKQKNKYYYGEKIIVIVTNSLHGASGEEFSGFQWEFSIKPEKQTFPYFTQPTIYPQFGGYDIISADINDDGYPDIILNSGQIIKNDSNGNFSIFQQLQISGDLAPNLSDIDYDGYKDLMIGSYVYEQNDDGFFYIDTTLKTANIDFNNDGFLDRVKFGIISPGDTTNFIGIVFNDGNGGFYSEVDTIVIDKNILGVINASDFNNDGIRDIAYITNVFATPYGVGGENKLKIMYMEVTGDTSYSFVIHNDQFPGGNMGGLFQLLAADFNNDNYQDILLITNVEDLIVFNDGIGGFLTNENDYQITGGGDTYHSAAIGDINGDGWPGLVYNSVIGNYETALTSIVRNDSGDYNYRPWIYSKDLAAVFYSTTADFNGDGALDIATTWYDGLYVHFNNDANSINESNLKLPSDFIIFQNYPNPFNFYTNIQFEIFKPLIFYSNIFDINGKEVKVFKKKKYLPGIYSLKWNGNNNLGKGVSSGIYFWFFESGEFSIIKKILLIK